MRFTYIDNTIQKFVINDLTINISHDEMVWAPSEYAKMFAHILYSIDINGLEICDVGTGSGILGILCALRGARVTALDLNPNAVSLTKTNAHLNNVNIQCLLSDGFSVFSHGKKKYFDLIVCNPPTLPKTNVNDNLKNAEQWNQNGEGRSVLDEVLYYGMNYLNSGGKLITCSSSEQHWKKTLEALKKWKKWNVLKKISFPMSNLYTPFINEWLRSGLIRKQGSVFLHDVHFIEAVF